MGETEDVGDVMIDNLLTENDCKGKSGKILCRVPVKIKWAVLFIINWYLNERNCTVLQQSLPDYTCK